MTNRQQPSQYRGMSGRPETDPVRENVEILARQRGNILDSAVTMRDLEAQGLVEIRKDGTIKWRIQQS